MVRVHARAGEPRRIDGRIVEEVPRWGPKYGALFLKGLGAVEVGMGLWALSGLTPVTCAIAQTILLTTLNANGLLWSRHLIHDPAGMVVKNFAFLVLVWVFGGLVAAALPILVGGLAMTGTLAVLRTITFFTDVSVLALNVATALGLALSCAL